MKSKNKGFFCFVLLFCFDKKADLEIPKRHSLEENIEFLRYLRYVIVLKFEMYKFQQVTNLHTTKVQRKTVVLPQIKSPVTQTSHMGTSQYSPPFLIWLLANIPDKAVADAPGAWIAATHIGNLGGVCLGEPWLLWPLRGELQEEKISLYL